MSNCNFSSMRATLDIVCYFRGAQMEKYGLLTNPQQYLNQYFPWPCRYTNIVEVILSDIIIDIDILRNICSW